MSVDPLSWPRVNPVVWDALIEQCNQHLARARRAEAKLEQVWDEGYRAGWDACEEQDGAKFLAEAKWVNPYREPRAEVDYCGDPHPCAHRNFDPDCPHPVDPRSL